MKTSRLLFIPALIFVLFSISAFAEELPSAALAYYSIDNLVLLFCAVLVLMMQPGFALLEAGLNPIKNTVHVTFKNMIDLSFGVLLYFLVGYSLMYGADVSGGLGLIGWSGFGISSEISPADIGAGALHPQVDWLFQVAFAATAATIVGGAITGRMSLKAYIYYTVFMTAIVYPISGFWKWGGGWLDQLGFYDFAGSIVVHSVGGFAALAGIIVLGPRIGRFNRDGSVNPIPGHSMVMAGLGVFILMIGWFGFNPGSQLAFSGSANIDAVMLIAVNTTLAAASGAVVAMIYGWITAGKAQVITTMNGILAGLVGITANCDGVTNFEAIIIGAVAGALVILGARFLEKMRLDDVVGAWPVHGLCGVWGGIATGIFTEHALGPQIIGSIAIPLWAFLTMYALFRILKAAGILRVKHGEEILGLDMAEHGEVEDGVQFKWREEFVLHVPEIDKEHKNLIRIIGEIIEAMKSGLGKGAIEDAFQGLLDYTVHHFRHEEELIEKYGYPMTAEHKAIHEKLTAQVLAYHKDLMEHDSFNAKDFQDFMSGWLINHILENDRHYAEFINNKRREGDNP